ncbi:peptidoglycan hydrolase-like protein with peptidoglycan-binding domain [Bradyrhizobium sp. GM5.1]
MNNVNPDTCRMDQGFGSNPQIYAPLKGHPAIDVDCGYGSLVHSPFDMYVYKVLTVANPANDGSGFTGVFGIVDNGIELYEYLIGHCDPKCSPGQNIKAGEVIGTEANHGLVFSNGVQITLAMQKAGDKRGSHRHCQKRTLRRTSQTLPEKKYLSSYSDWPAGSVYRDATGNYYEIWDYDSGFNGCVDPTKSIFQRTLTIGATGYDVYVLQRLMVKQGVADFEPTGYFGQLTLSALATFQRKHGIMPDAGFFGPKTRQVVQEKWGL